MTAILTLLIGLLLPATELVTGVSVVPSIDRTEILISVDGSVSYRAFSMEAPARIVVDLLNARHALSQEDFLDINRGGVLSVRTSQYSEDIVRIVVDLRGMTEYTVQQSDGAVRISLDNTGGDFPPWQSPSLTFNPAFVASAAPFVEAVVQAQEAERSIQAGDYKGPLHGIPVAVKDIIHTRGVLTSAGSKVLADHIPDEDSTIVERLNNAGAVLLGKLNLSEFAIGGTIDHPFGTPRNPWNTNHTAGGSSSGSAIAPPTANSLRFIHHSHA